MEGEGGERILLALHMCHITIKHKSRKDNEREAHICPCLRCACFFSNSAYYSFPSPLCSMWTPLCSVLPTLSQSLSLCSLLFAIFFCCLLTVVYSTLVSLFSSSCSILSFSLRSVASSSPFFSVCCALSLFSPLISVLSLYSFSTLIIPCCSLHPPQYFSPFNFSSLCCLLFHFFPLSMLSSISPPSVIYSLLSFLLLYSFSCLLPCLTCF